MGVDVQLYAQGDITDEQVAAAERFLRSRLGDPPDWKTPAAWLHRNQWHDDRVDFTDDFMRYYGPHYERGDWPRIHSWIRLMMAAFPDAEICYGGDSDFSCPVVDAEFLERVWEHYLGPHGDDYWVLWRAFGGKREV